MIEEDYVSFETAKLLKEKGFNEKCNYVYMWTGNMVAAQYFMEGESFVDNDDIDAVAKYNEWITYTQGEYAYLCPTIHRAMKWLREVHDLHITAYPWRADREERATHWCCKVHKSFNLLGYEKYTDETPKSYEKACESAIKYCLENLI